MSRLLACWHQMFGTLRFLLAIIVVLSHLWLPNYIGHYAVFGFYVLSGYLMTLIMQRSYGYTWAGFRRFSINRILRIFPAYWAAVGLGLLVVLTIPYFPRALNPALQVPDTTAEILSNLTLFGLTVWTPARLVPPAWALGTEVLFYILIGLHLGRSRGVACLWFALSLLATIAMVETGASLAHRYFSPIGASLPFSIGAVLFHYRDDLLRLLRPVGRLVSLAILVLAFVLNMILAAESGREAGSYFYSSLALIAPVILLLSSYSSKAWDQFLGNLSYPIYLLHWQIAAVTFSVAGLAPGRSAELFWLSLPVILLGSVACYYGIEARVEGVRVRVKVQPDFPAGRRSPAQAASVVERSAVQG